MIGKKIVIFGHSDETVGKATELFINEVVNNVKAEDEVFFSATKSKIVKEKYEIDNLTLNGIDIKNYTVVHPNKGTAGEKQLADSFAEYISEFSGYSVKSKDDKSYSYAEGNYEILIGNTNRNASFPEDLGEDESYVKVDGKTVLITGGGYLGLYNAVNKLRDTISEKKDTNIAVTLDESCRETIHVETLKVMSFNLWVAEKTPARDARVLEMINKYTPDVLGVQEASPEWMSTLTSNLVACSYVGLGRDGGSNGEYSAVFYRKDKFTLLGQETRWLSDTPNVVSKYPESSYNRILSYAILQRNSDGKVFVHVNTHFEHTNDISREKQADALLNAISKINENYVVILTGDFNCTKDTLAYKKITDGGFINTSELAVIKQGNGTFHNYSGMSRIIDFCFVNNSEIPVIKYKVCDEKIDGVYPSDHHPVYVEFMY